MDVPVRAEVMSVEGLCVSFGNEGWLTGVRVPELEEEVKWSGYGAERKRRDGMRSK